MATDVLAGRDYLDRLDHPAPWTVDTVRHFRGVARSLCEVAWSRGAGEGGLMATWRYDVAPARASGHRAAMAGALEALSGTPGIAGAHLLVADEAASAIETAEKKARGTATAIPRWVALVEGWGDAPAFVAKARAFAGGEAFADAAVPPDLAVYRLQNALAAAR